jgi:hypothetical protein
MRRPTSNWGLSVGVASQVVAAEVRYVEACVLTKSKEPEAKLDPAATGRQHKSRRHTEPEKDILCGREFVKGDVWRIIRDRQAGHLKGDSSGDP